MVKREGVNAPGHVGPSLFQGNELVNTKSTKDKLIIRLN